MASSCPACLESVPRKGVARCSQCRARLHEACWVEFGGCLNCGAGESLRAARRRQPHKRYGFAWIVFVAGILALNGSLRSVSHRPPPPPPSPPSWAAPAHAEALHARPERCAPKPRHAAPTPPPARRPETPQEVLRQADGLLRSGQANAAYKRYRLVVRAKPRLAEAALGCARSSLRSGHLERAHYWLSYARELKPGSERLARLLERLERHLVSHCDDRPMRKTRSF